MAFVLRASCFGFLFFLASLTAFATVNAQTKTDAKPAEAKAGSKYGVVDMQAVILGVTEGKQAREKLEKEIKSKEQELLKQKETLDKMNDEWKTQAPLMSEEARFKKQQEFQEKFLGLRNEEMTFQADIKRKEQKATQQIAVKVSGMVEKIAKEKHLEAVFESNSSGLLYLENPVDLTQDVIRIYEKEKPSDLTVSKKDETPKKK